MIPLLTRLPLWARILAAVVVIGVVFALVSGLYKVAAAALFGLGAMLFGGARGTKPDPAQAANTERADRERAVADDMLRAAEAARAATAPVTGEIQADDLRETLRGRK